MNIFYISHSPKQAAEWMVDKHIIKMILESAQLLSTAHRVLDGIPTVVMKNGRKLKRYNLDGRADIMLYQATHINHPCSVWTRESDENYKWVYDHFMALNEEYVFRYGKIHKCFSIKDELMPLPNNIPILRELTPPKCAMKEEFIISDDPVVNYRNYYKNGKAHLFSWKKRTPPKWIAA